MQKTSKKLSATPIPSTEKYLYGVCVIVNKKLSPIFDAVKLTPSTHNTANNQLFTKHYNSNGAANVQPTFSQQCSQRCNRETKFSQVSLAFYKFTLQTKPNHRTT